MRFKNNTGPQNGDLHSTASGSYVYRQLRRLGVTDYVGRQTAPLLHPVSVAPGQRLLPDSEAGRRLFSIISGWIGGSVFLSSSARPTVELYGPGLWIGESVLDEKSNGPFEYVCLSEVEVYEIPWEKLEPLIATDPASGLGIAAFVAGRHRERAERSILVRHASPFLKVLMGLALSAETASLTAELGPENGCWISLPLPQSTLAEACGVSRTVFSSVALNLEKEGLLSIGYSRTDFRDRDRWLSFLELFRSHSLMALDSIEAAIRK